MERTTMMTNQQIYDKAKADVLAQGCRSLRGPELGSSCAYRGRNGTKCAIGMFIPDHRYRPELEQVGTGTLTRGGHNGDLKALVCEMKSILQDVGVPADTDQEIYF